ncbi:T3SS effector HopA1 family protein [Streptomyces sp. S07_1.15]|uniref:T3SS effector HopA1 family protein n=1 Tax=Streptomyces sp. S07_1.15 TaxID=2873925 RepID=UPI001D14A64D|nr:T3SS effector HopA1 family protein [Streptomyces sp. S07_1.15]MCC3651249.1 T3SS effector HopA1 family protein [Streptomyces sp. S07_1.15]
MSTDTAATAAAVTAAAASKSAPGRLSPGLRRALAAVTTAPGATSALVEGEEVTAESAAVLRLALARVLYEVLHTGRGLRDEAPPKSLRAPAYEERLADATPHRETVVPGTDTGERARGGGRLMEIDGLRVAVPDAVRLRAGGSSRAPEGAGAGPGGTGPAAEGRADRRAVRIALPAARPALSPGFFLVDSGAGRVGPGGLLRVYLRVADAEAAPALWNAVLTLLEERSAVYRAKIISNPVSLPRNDGMVVYLDPSSWGEAPRIAEAAVAAGVPDAVRPAFAHPLAPGVTAAWEPEDGRPGMTGLSFGEHRAHVLARCCVEAALDGRERPGEDELAAACAEANIDPADPARNLTSRPWPWLPPLG